MSVDCFSTGTEQHPVCQDYCLADAVNGLSRVALSDGCSTQPMTDWGARFLCNVAMRYRYVPGKESGESFVRSVIERAVCGFDDLRIHFGAMTATLLAAYETKQGAEVVMAGDGFVIGRRRDGRGVSMTQVAYDNEAPFYPRYLLLPDDLAGWRKQFGGEWEASQRLLFRVEDRPCNDMGPYPPDNRADFPTFTFLREIYDMVLVASDGLNSFTKSDYDGMDWMPKHTRSRVPATEVVERLMQFKSTAGCFLQRRVRAFLKESAYAHDNGNGEWRFGDDISVAGFTMEEI